MKKILLTVLCLVTVISLTACGESGNGPEPTEKSGGTSDTNVSAGENSENNENNENNENSENSEISQSEKLVISEAVKPANFTLTDSGADYETYFIENVCYEDVMNYESTLRNEGFYIHGSSYGYDKEAESLQYDVKYNFNYKGTSYVTNYDQFEERAAKGEKDYGDLNVTVRARDLSGYNLPELPKDSWFFQDNAIKGTFYHCLSTYENCGRDTRKNMATDYVEKLKASGYTVNAEEYPDGKEGNYVTGYVPLYYYYAEDANKNSVKVVVSSSEDVAVSLVGLTSAEWAKIEITFKKGE